MKNKWFMLISKDVEEKHKNTEQTVELKYYYLYAEDQFLE